MNPVLTAPNSVSTPSRSVRAISQPSRAILSASSAMATSSALFAAVNGADIPPGRAFEGWMGLPPIASVNRWPNFLTVIAFFARSGEWRARPMTLRVSGGQSWPRMKSGAASIKKWRECEWMYCPRLRSSRSFFAVAGGSTPKIWSVAFAAARWCEVGQIPQIRGVILGASSIAAPLRNFSNPLSSTT